MYVDHKANAARHAAEVTILAKYAAEVDQEEAKILRQLRMRDVARIFLTAVPNRKIEAIKLVRTAFEVGLREAKDIVDEVVVELAEEAVKDRLPF